MRSTSRLRAAAVSQQRCRWQATRQALFAQEGRRRTAADALPLYRQPNGAHAVLPSGRACLSSQCSRTLVADLAGAEPAPSLPPLFAGTCRGQEALRLGAVEPRAILAASCSRTDCGRHLFVVRPSRSAATRARSRPRLGAAGGCACAASAARLLDALLPRRWSAAVLAASSCLSDASRRLAPPDPIQRARHVRSGVSELPPPRAGRARPRVAVCCAYASPRFRGSLPRCWRRPTLVSDTPGAPLRIVRSMARLAFLTLARGRAGQLWPSHGF